MKTEYSDKNHKVAQGNIVDTIHAHILEPQNKAFIPQTWAAEIHIIAPIIHIIDFFCWFAICTFSFMFLTKQVIVKAKLKTNKIPSIVYHHTNKLW